MKTSGKKLANVKRKTLKNLQRTIVQDHLKTLQEYLAPSKQNIKK